MKALHRWDLTPAQARELQTSLATRVDKKSRLESSAISNVLAVDVSMNRFATWLAAAAVVCDVNQRKTTETSTVIQPIRFPYVTGMLAFREIPALLEAIGLLKSSYDAVLVDGQGLAHPRGLGLACHLGLWLGKPTIGLAKTRLCGTFADVPNKAGAHVPLVLGEHQVGVVYRTKRNCLPIFISVGHKCRLLDAVELVGRLTDNRRIAWPIRAAHEAANEARRRHQAGLSA